ncbi:MAG: hypothetical protein QOI10_2008 [Solirubrobacterales bacterium]|jgi:hypothetical protein|nr:hypothetical protein [Solirubrobacterales bacterium]
MKRLVPLVIRPWMLPLIVAALVLPIVAGFAVAGPPLGLGLGACAVAALLFIAARASYDEPIETAPSTDRRYRVLVVADEPVSDPGLVERIVAIAEEGRAVLDRDQPPELLVLAPARASLLDRWASDLGEARDAAARVLAISLASLAAAGLDASGRIGDPDPVQAIRDELLSFPAREVVLVAGPGLGAAESEEVGRRLDRPVRLLQPNRPTSSA